MTDLDRFDRQLLDLVQQDAALTAEQLAEHVSLSPSAIQRRLRRLRDQGVIVRQVAVLDAAQVGRPTTFIAGLQVQRHHRYLKGIGAVGAGYGMFYANICCKVLRKII